jgi:hypothetical protein
VADVAVCAAVFGDRLQLDAGKETVEALAARSPEERLADAQALIARAKRRVAEAWENGEVTEADFEERQQRRREGVIGVLTRAEGL